jgi:hypothetical protein
MFPRNIINNNFYISTETEWSTDIAVGITTNYGLDGNGVSPARDKICSLLHVAQLPILWVPGALSPGVKRPVHEADHLPPTSAEFKNRHFMA